MKNLLTLFALCLAGLGLSWPAAAEHCSDVRFRLWRQGAPADWYQHGETLEVTTGEEVHLYIHTRGRGDNSYSTTAEIGYPSGFGFREDSRRVRSHLRMTAQNDDDHRSGRVRLVAEKPGVTQLGYRIEGIKPPGDLGQLARQCRVGSLNIEVRSRRQEIRDEPPIRPQGGGGGARQAARELVEMLYQGILRRDRVPSDPESFIHDVLRDGQQGLERIAVTMTVSEEFRYQALERTEKSRDRSRDLDRLRSALLNDIYRDLYGYLAPSRSDRAADLEDLDRCLSGERRRREACTNLGRNLVTSNLFYEQNQRLVDSAFPRRGRGRRR